MRALSEWLYNDNIPKELQRNGDIECYDKVMDEYPNYPMIWYCQMVSTLTKTYRIYLNKIITETLKK
jgi:hypothetical protein